MDNITQEQRDKADALFRTFMRRLPKNTNAVYFECETKGGWKLYIPTNITDNNKLENQKKAYDKLIEYAGY